MITNRNAETDSFGSPGERLNLILDQIGFKQGRGRVTDFQCYLTDIAPEAFSDLRYTTVRAWFQDHAPPMQKINAIIQALQKKYTFRHDVSQIKTWWKVGGICPFENIDFDEKRAEFTASSVLMSIGGTEKLSGEQLVDLREKLVQFLKDFANPSITDCSNEYLKLVATALIEQDSKNS